MIKYSAIFCALSVIAGMGAVFAIGFTPDRTCKAADLVQMHRSMTFK